MADVSAMPASGDGVILFFTPEAGVRAHLAAQCVVARTMQERGHRVLFVRCFDLFARCPVMDMYQLPYTHAREALHDTCLRCAGASMELLRAYGFEHVDLRLLATPDVRELACDAARSAPADLRQFEYEGIPFGRIAALDLVLATKVSDFDLVSDVTRVAWLQYIESGVLAHLLVDRLCQRVDVRRMVHYNHYVLLLGARLAAERHGIPSVTLTHASHNNVDRRRYVLATHAGASLEMASIHAWPAWRELCLSDAQVRDVSQDLLTRLRGGQSHQFSPPRTFHHADIRDALGLARDRKLVVAYTSSLDEMIAEAMRLDAQRLPPRASASPFANQVEWLQELIAHVERSNDLQLVVRVHPREGPGLRAGSSQHLALLRTEFDRGYHACRFIWPDDPTSSFDLAEAADLALISWSTIGIELARLGVPVLASTLGIGANPHDDFIEWRGDSASYFAEMARQLARPAQLDTVTRAFRWYNLGSLAPALDLGDVIPTSDFTGLPPFRLPREAEVLEQAVLGRTDLMSLNHERQRAAQGPTSVADERRALQRELRRLIHFFCTGLESSVDVPLLVNPSRPDASGARVMRIEGGTIHYAFDGQTLVRYSPLCARLAPLCAS